MELEKLIYRILVYYKKKMKIFSPNTKLLTLEPFALHVIFFSLKNNFFKLLIKINNIKF